MSSRFPGDVDAAMRATLLEDSGSTVQRTVVPSKARRTGKKRNERQASCLVRLWSQVCNAPNPNRKSAL